MEVDSSGKKGPNEVEAYKVVKGALGNRQTTYYDREWKRTAERSDGRAGRDRQSQPMVPLTMYLMAYTGSKFAGKKGLAREFGEEAIRKGDEHQ